MKSFKWALGAAGLFVAAGLIAFAVTTAVDTASAAPGDAAKNHQQYLADQLGISVEKLAAAQQAAHEKMLQEAVASGRLTQEQADAMKNRAPGMHRGAGAALKHGVQNIMNTAAAVIGISQEQLKTEMQSGKSLTQVAQDHNVSRDALKAGLNSRLQADIQTALSGGQITQDQATKLLQGLTERIDSALDRVPGTQGERPFPGRGPRPAQ